MWLTFPWVNDLINLFKVIVIIESGLTFVYPLPTDKYVKYTSFLCVASQLKASWNLFLNEKILINICTIMMFEED